MSSKRAFPCHQEIHRKKNKESANKNAARSRSTLPYQMIWLKSSFTNPPSKHSAAQIDLHQIPSIKKYWGNGSSQHSLTKIKIYCFNSNSKM